ncbi:MAG: ABC transporter permease subunit [candidate division NC10 bacterium]|nr:ABC transporter permease subunit [candidate division NC10 bacterium]
MATILEVKGPHSAVGMVFQEDSAFPWLTALENIEFGLRMKGVSREERRARAQAMIEWAGPLFLPSIMTGLRLGFNLTFLGIILGEMFGARRGLGFLLMAFGAAFDMERVLVVIILVALLAIGINSAFYLVERRLGREEEMRLLRM